MLDTNSCTLLANCIESRRQFIQTISSHSKLLTDRKRVRIYAHVFHVFKNYDGYTLFEKNWHRLSTKNGRTSMVIPHNWRAVYINMNRLALCFHWSYIYQSNINEINHM